MKISIASDHGGFLLKEELKDYLTSLGHEIVDCGTNSLESCDYPDYVIPTAKAVANGEFDRGVVVCGTGLGVSMTANKVHGIRCAVCHDTFSAKATRQHNDANMLAMGGRIIDDETAMAITEAFIDTEFEGGRHQRRIDKIEEA